MKITDDGAVKLMEAVLNKAKDDYIHDYDVKTIELFLHSEYGQLYLSIANLNAEDVIKNWKEQRAHFKWRERMGCTQCPLKASKAKDRERCIHEKPGHYTHERVCIVMEKGGKE